MNTSFRFGALMCALFFSIVLSPSAFPQGSLTPPGTPAPTMKTLDQIEPRIAVNSTNTAGDADSIYVITQPGSYYLTGNVTGASGKNGIEIAASDVTLDLMGFEVIGGAGSSRGIYATAGNGGNSAIRNGTVRNWGQRGIDLSLVNCNYHLLSDLRVLVNSHGGIQGNLALTITNCTVSSNGDYGIQVQDLAVITGCTVQSNGGGFGISTGTGSVVTHCAARFNSGGISVSSGSTVTNSTAVSNFGKGIVAGDGCTISDCVAYSNNGDGFTAGKGCTLRHCSSYTNAGGGDGMEIGEGTSIVDSTSYENAGYGILAATSVTVSGCMVWKNSQSGISVGGGVVTRCDSSWNNFDGIRVISECRITENKCYSNGPGGFSGAGIHVTQSNCTIENNSVASNDIGIDVDSSPNVIIHNSARANITTGNYDVIAGNMLGTIITSVSTMNAAANTYGNLSF